MARSRLSKRREAEAAEAQEAGRSAGKKKKATKKKAAKKKATRKKKTATSRSRRTKDAPPRRRLVWVVYSSTMREEGRFLYHERDQAEEKLKQLLAKGKRRYFIQPIKEPLDSEGNPIGAEPVSEGKPAAQPKAEETAAEEAGDRKTED